MAPSFDSNILVPMRWLHEDKVFVPMSLLKNGAGQLSLLLSMCWSLHGTAFSGTEPLGCLCVPKAFSPLCAFLLPLFTWRFHIPAFYQYLNMSLFQSSRFKLLAQHLGGVAELGCPAQGQKLMILMWPFQFRIFCVSVRQAWDGVCFCTTWRMLNYTWFII